MKNQNAFTLGMIVMPLALLGLGVAFASSVATPNTFTAGTVAMASQVNDNFTAHASAINDNDTKITANTAAIAALPPAVRGKAQVEEDGTLNRSFSAGGFTVTATRINLGFYEVDFGEDLTTAASFYFAAIMGETDAGEPGREINVVGRQFNANAVFVEIRNSAGTLVDSDFAVFVL